ncbi:MAG: histidine kinase [Clostridia bacterium]
MKRVITIIAIVAILLMIVVLLCIPDTCFPMGVFERNNVAGFNDGWILQNGEESKLPVVIDVPPNTAYYIFKDIPKEFDESQMSIAFQSFYQDVVVSMDEEVIYRFEKPKDLCFGKAAPKHLNVIDIPLHSAGKQLKVQVSSPYKNYSVIINHFLYGPRDRIELDLIKQDLLQYIAAFGLVLLGIFLLVIAAVKCLNKYTVDGLIWFALFVMDMGIFILSDNMVFCFQIGNDYLCNYISIYSFIALPVIYFTYAQKKLNGNIKQYASILTLVGLIYIVIITGLQILNILDLIETARISRILTVGVQIYALIDGIKYKRHIPLSVMLFIAMAITFVTFLYTGKISWIMIIAIYIYSLYIAYGIISDSAKKVKEGEQYKIKAAQYNNDLSIVQIGTHFFYHVINATRTLIKTKPDVAYQMLGNFAKYLRYKTDGNRISGNMVRFSDEMKAIYAYINLEKEIMGDRLRVIYQIEDDQFYIPVLTIQPLVENAIEHGIGKRKEGGTVIISVKKEAEYYIVTVEDDGVGFGEEVEINNRGISIAQDNIKERLTYYGDNEIMIQSIPDQGTKITVKFSKVKENQTHADDIRG